MALQDVLCEFLHHEIVAYFNEKPGKKVSITSDDLYMSSITSRFMVLNERFQKNDITELEYLGFSCGYRIIER